MDGISSTAYVPSATGGDLGAIDTSPKSRAELEKTARKLEGVFLSMIVKQMRESMTEDGLFGKESGGETYGGLFDQMMGEKLADRSSLGIAELVIRTTLERQDGFHYPAHEITPEKARVMFDARHNPSTEHNAEALK